MRELAELPSSDGRLRVLVPARFVLVSRHAREGQLRAPEAAALRARVPSLAIIRQERL